MAKIFTDKDFNSEDLLESGLDHLTSAEYLLGSKDPRMFDSAGYLAHVGIELMIKSWLLHENKKFEGIHPLEDLLNQLKASVLSFHFTETEKQTIDYLSNFVELRYPNKNKPIEIGEEDIDQIYDLANSIWLQMPDDLIVKFEALPSTKKGGRVLMQRPSHIPRNLEFETGIKNKK